MSEIEATTFAIGEPCGVCQFTTGKGTICGNVVYANQLKGRLPRYCGQAGQAEWHAKHGTEGVAGHMSDRAGYPRRIYDMTTEQAAELAEAEAVQRGIGRRNPGADDHADAVEAAPVLSAVPDVPEQQPAEPESAVDALADLATALTGRVIAVRREMEELQATCDAQITETETERERLADEVAAQLQGLAADQELAKATTERALIEVREANDRADTAIREATDIRLQVEGELKAARQRVADLEAALAAAEKRRVSEVAEVRETEYQRFRELVREFAATTRPQPETAAPEPRKAPTTPGPDAQEKMMQRVRNGHVTVVDREWVLSNAKANTAAANTLSWLLEESRITVTDEGQVSPVTLATVREDIDRIRREQQK